MRNFFDPAVFIPNSTVANVNRFPHGGVYASADIQIPMPTGPERDQATSAIRDVAGCVAKSHPHAHP
jgi:hypothetical protein